MADCGLGLPNVEDLSKEQLTIRTLPPGGRHLIAGPPGSGKTVMAVYRANRLKKKHGVRPSLIMYNKLLSRYTAEATRLAGADTSVRTLHSWFPMVYKAGMGHAPPEVDKWTFDWNAMMVELASGQLPELDRPHVIVDEGQDFPNVMYLVLKQITSSLTVFADENQALKPDGENSTISEIQRLLDIEHVMPLSVNYRNSLPIANVAERFHTKIRTGIARVPPGTLPGDPVALVKDRDMNSLIARLVRWERAHSHECIGVFVPYTNLQETIYNRLNGKTTNQVQIYSWKPSVMQGRNPVRFSVPGIKVLSYASAKGLEFSTVFIPLLEKFIKGNGADAFVKFASSFYVMSSRARRNLFFHYSGTHPPAILKHLPLDLMEDRR